MTTGKTLSRGNAFLSYALTMMLTLTAFLLPSNAMADEAWVEYDSSNTKLAITLFTLDLARRVKGKGITVNASDPGVVNTEIIRMQMFFDPLTDLFFLPFIRTPRQGADTAIRLLLDENKEEQTGTFCRSNRVVELGDKYIHHRQMETLWNETEKIVKPFME